MLYQEIHTKDPDEYYREKGTLGYREQIEYIILYNQLATTFIQEEFHRAQYMSR